MTDNTEQKEQEQDAFEGVRAEVVGGIHSHSIHYMNGNAYEAMTKKLHEEIAHRWNAYPKHQAKIGDLEIKLMDANTVASSNERQTEVLRKKMDELADKIVEMEKSSNNSLDKLGDSNGKLLLACSNLSDKDAEITRLKEEALDEARKLFEAHEENSRLGSENEKLKEELSSKDIQITNLKTLPDDDLVNYIQMQKTIDEADKYINVKVGYVQPFVNAARKVARLKEENERLKAYIEEDDKHKKGALEEIAALASDYKECKSQLSQAKERIEELEPPNEFHIVCDYPEDAYVSDTARGACDEVAIGEIAEIVCRSVNYNHKNKFGVWIDNSDFRTSDTKEQAQAALKEGE